MRISPWNLDDITDMLRNTEENVNKYRPKLYIYWNTFLQSDKYMNYTSCTISKEEKKTRLITLYYC